MLSLQEIFIINRIRNMIQEMNNNPLFEVEDKDKDEDKDKNKEEDEYEKVIF